MGGGKGGGSTSYNQRPLTYQEILLINKQREALGKQMDLADRMVTLSEKNQNDWENTYRPFEVNDLKQSIVDVNTNMGKVDPYAYAALKANTFSGLSSGYEQAQKNLDAQMAMRGLTNSGIHANSIKDLYTQKANAMANANAQAYNQGVQIGDAYRQQRLANLTGYAQLGRGMSGQAANYLQGATNAYGDVGKTAGSTAGQLGSFDNAYNSAQWNAKAQAQAGKGAMGGSLIGAGATLGSAAILASDERLKDNIEQVGEYKGLAIYKWNWNDKAKELGLDKYPPLGFIAQEVLKSIPKSVIMDDDGYYRINYSMILEA